MLTQHRLIFTRVKTAEPTLLGNELSILIVVKPNITFAGRVQI